MIAKTYKKRNSSNSIPQFVQNIPYFKNYVQFGMIQRKLVKLVAFGRKLGGQRQAWRWISEMCIIFFLNL